VAVKPSTLSEVSAWRTSSSLKGLMTAVTSFILLSFDRSLVAAFCRGAAPPLKRKTPLGPTARPWGFKSRAKVDAPVHKPCADTKLLRKQG
jgi:hypothetical protein